MVAASAGEFLGDSLQRIDAAQPHHDLLTTELVDRLGEPLGDLTLLSDRQLGPGMPSSCAVVARRLFSSASRLSCSCRQVT